MKVSAPKPRTGIKRSHPRPHRITPISRGSTPVFRATTPSRAGTPSDAPTKRQRPCANPECPSPNVKLTDDMSAYVCQTCGVMANETVNLVSEPGFAEGQGGRITAVGVQVGHDQTHTRSGGRMAGTGNVGQEATSNRRIAEATAKRFMTGWLTNLHYPPFEAEAGMRVFGLAWQWQFIKGRSLSDVAIVCLYLALRRAKDHVRGKAVPRYPIMLIDFAELADVDVFMLGKMFGDLVRKIYGNADGGIMDEEKLLLAPGPEVLIPRFIDSLDFPPHTSNKIRDDAIKIVRRMDRDWMADGRRPAGICGAAVILAARMNNHRRSTREVMLTAKVTEITLNKRLEEFSDLPSSKLSVNDFRDDQIREAITASNPPAYTKGMQGPQPKRKRGRPRKNAPETAAEIENGGQTEEQQEEPPAKRPRLDAEGFAIPDLPKRPSTEEASASQPVQELRRGPGRPKGAKNWRAPPTSDAEQLIEEELQRDIDFALARSSGLQLDGSTQNPASGTEDEVRYSEYTSLATESATSPLLPASLEGSYPLPPPPSSRDPPGPAVDSNIGNLGNISLSPTLQATEFEDDPDVANCILSEPERVLKEKIWVTANEDWLRQDHAKRIKRELKEAEMRERGESPSQLKKDGTGKQSKFARKVGRWGDVSYLHAGKGKGKKASGKSGEAADGAEGTPAAEGHEDDDTGSPSRNLDAGEAMAKFLVHRANAFTSSSRRIDLDAVHRLYQLDTFDSSSQASDEPDTPGSTDGRRRSASTLRGSGETEGRSIIKPSRHSESALKRQARLRAEEAERQQQSRGQSAASDTAGQRGTSGARGQGDTISPSPTPGSTLGPATSASATTSSRIASTAITSRYPSTAITIPDPVSSSTKPGQSSSPSTSQDHASAVRSPPTATTTASTSQQQQRIASPSSQPHTPASTSTLSILDDGSVEEVIGEVTPGAASGNGHEEGEEEEIHLRDGGEDGDEVDDDDDDEEGSEEAENEADLDDAFEGRFRPRSRRR